MPPLALISFAAPLMLAGLALAVLPLIAHLMNRHAKRRVVFPTIAFLKESSAAQSQLFRMRRWILLALRCLFVAFIALAFAQPIWQGAGAVADSSEGAALVVLLDASASTRQSQSGVQLFDTLTAAADRTIGNLRSGVDYANVVYADAQPKAALPRLSANLPQLQQDLRAAQPTYERADMAAALGMAGDMLKQHGGPRRMAILSDLQSTNWQEALERAESQGALPAGVEVEIVKPNAEAPENLTLATARCQPRNPLTGQAAQLIVNVSNHSQASKEARLQVKLNGKSIAAPTVTLAPGEQRDVPVETTFDSLSSQQIEFSLGSDSLEADNKAFLVVRPKEKLPVVIVSDDSPAEAGTAAYYLQRALAPTNDAADRFQVRHLSSRSLSSAALADASAVFVGYLGQISPASAKALADHIRQGGGVVVFAGEGPVRRNLLTLNAAAESDVLPWTPGSVKHARRRDDAFAITGGRWRSPLLQEFDVQSQLGIANIQFRQVWDVGPIHPESQILLTFSDDTPALGLRRIGAGRLLVANFSPTASTSDFGKHGAFVAFAQMLAKELRPSASAEMEAVVGRAYRHQAPLPAASGDALSVVGPQGASSGAVLTPLPGDKMNLQIPRPSLPGIYTIEQAGTIVDAVAINVDRREGDLSRLPVSEIEQGLKQASGRVTSSDAQAWTAGSEWEEKPLWGWMMVLALTIIAVELSLLSWWGR